MEGSVIILGGENTKVHLVFLFFLHFVNSVDSGPTGLLVLRGYFFGAFNNYGRTFLVCLPTRFVKCYLFAVHVSLFPWLYSSP